MRKRHQRLFKNRIFLTIFFILFIGCSNNEKIAEKLQEKEEYILLRGINYSQNDMFLEAEKEFLKILSKDENNLILLEELAFVKLKLREDDEALKLYKSILKKDSKNINALKNISYIFLKNSDYKRSMEYLKQVPISLEDEETEVLYEEIFYKSKNWEKIELLLENKAALEKIYSEKLDKRYAESLLGQNKKDKLYFYLMERYKNNYSNESFLIFKTNILEKEYQEYEKSERIIKRYISQYSYSDEMLFSLGENYLKQKKYDEIEKMLKLVSSASIYNERFLKLKEAVKNY